MKLGKWEEREREECEGENGGMKKRSGLKVQIKIHGEDLTYNSKI